MQDHPIAPHRTSAQGTRPGRRTTVRITAGAALVVLVGLGLYVAFRPLGGGSSGPPAASPASSVSDGGEVGVGVGQRAPDFTGADGQTSLLTGLDDAPIQVGDFDGRPLWIVFWATWCTPCQQEATDIRAAFHAHEDDNLAVLAIDVQEPTVAVRAYVAAHDLDYTIGLDPTGAVMALYGARGLPSHVFIDAFGIIRDRYAGQLTRQVMEDRLGTIIGN